MRFEAQLTKDIFKQNILAIRLVLWAFAIVAIIMVVMKAKMTDGATVGIILSILQLRYTVDKNLAEIGAVYCTSLARIDQLRHKLNTDGTGSIEDAGNDPLKVRRVNYHYETLYHKVVNYSKGVEVTWEL